MSLVFPTFLFNPTSLRVRIDASAQTGGPALGGISQFAETSGGGFVSITFGEVNLWAREKFLSWSALEAAMDNGATPLIVPLGDRRHAPLTSPAALLAFSDDTLWDDSTSWTAIEVDAVVSADAALGATSLDMDFSASVPLVGGERFSPLTVAYGWRLHTITRVTDNGGGNFTVTFRPPLREALAEGTPLNFDSPRCHCRLDGDPGGLLEMLRFGKGGPARFVESFATIG